MRRSVIIAIASSTVVVGSTATTGALITSFTFVSREVRPSTAIRRR